MTSQLLSALLVLFSLFQQAPAPSPAAFRVSGVVVDALGGQPLARTQVILSKTVGTWNGPTLAYRKNTSRAGKPSKSAPTQESKST
jgi:hypothetical protein